MNFNGIELADKKDKGYDTELVNRILNAIYLSYVSVACYAKISKFNAIQFKCNKKAFTKP